MSKFRKKPVVIEAMQLDGSTVEIAKWLTKNGQTFGSDTDPFDSKKDGSSHLHPRG